ncbi:hypothetical protein [Bradyrhizobium sp. ARR65]|uniref:hypothetical protein n=1 Tax=Bradyrhizobium sp. ARR65 TaxID=1040989 RepID=UPI000AE5F991|nr:hypothetical protein [Bradyrhizobium sp. ARR65]
MEAACLSLAPQLGAASSLAWMRFSRFEKMHVAALGLERPKFQGCSAMWKKNFLFARLETDI